MLQICSNDTVILLIIVYQAAYLSLIAQHAIGSLSLLQCLCTLLLAREAKMRILELKVNLASLF